MKAIHILIIIFFILTAIACNNQQSKRAVDSVDSVNSIDSIKKSPTEKSILKKKDKIGLKEIKECEYWVTEILKTSPRYKQLTKGLNKAVIKNGGQYFGISLERSPNKSADNVGGYSKTYDFTIYEMYTDRQLNVARFSFNPIDKQLYEYDAIHDQLNPIEFDKSLLLQFEALCK